MRIHHFSLLLLLVVPVIALAQTAPAAQQEPLAEQLFYQDQAQAQQRAAAQQEAQLQQQAVAAEQAQAEQNQASAEQDQANTLWQEQMDQEPDLTHAWPAVDAREILRQQEQRQDEQALYQQDQAEMAATQQQNNALLDRGREITRLDAEVDNDGANLTAVTRDLKTIAPAMNAIGVKVLHATTRKQLAAFKSQLDALHARADADRAKHNAIMRDLDRIQQQLNAPPASNP